VRLLITDPISIVADHADIVAVRAEDESGSFGILPGHTGLLTVLVPSVLAWRHAEGRRGLCAVRRGVLTVRGGQEVAVATRQAVLGDDLDELEGVVLARFQAELDTERSVRVESLRLHMQAIRQIVQLLQPDGPGP
jgi:F-type H+-transporting ATPase subunit epsilon